jgi:hypothetical protein
MIEIGDRVRCIRLGSNALTMMRGCVVGEEYTVIVAMHNSSFLDVEEIPSAGIYAEMKDFIKITDGVRYEDAEI